MGSGRIASESGNIEKDEDEDDDDDDDPPKERGYGKGSGKERADDDDDDNNDDDDENDGDNDDDDPPNERGYGKGSGTKEDDAYEDDIGENIANGLSARSSLAAEGRTGEPCGDTREEMRTSSPSTPSTQSGFPPENLRLRGLGWGGVELGLGVDLGLAVGVVWSRPLASAIISSMNVRQ